MVMMWFTIDSAWQMWSVLYAEAVECVTSAESVWHVGGSVTLQTFVTAEHGTYGCLEKRGGRGAEGKMHCL